MSSFRREESSEETEEQCRQRCKFVEYTYNVAKNNAYTVLQKIVKRFYALDYTERDFSDSNCSSSKQQQLQHHSVDSNLGKGLQSAYSAVVDDNNNTVALLQTKV